MVAPMTPAQLRILKTLPKVIEAVRAFQAESNELMGLLGERVARLPPVVPGQEIPSTAAARPHNASEAVRAGFITPEQGRAVLDAGAAEARAAAEAELARRQAEKTPEQLEAEAFLRNQEAPRRALLAAAGITS